MPDRLDGLAQSPEALIARAFFAVLKADTWLAARFTPILLIESPTRSALNELTVYTIAVVPFRVKLVDFPSHRQLTRLDMLVSVYVPKEQTREDSLLRGLDLGNHIRKLAWSNAELQDPSTPGRIITFATIDFAHLQPLEPKDSAVRILSFQITFQTDLDPATGQIT